MTDAPECQAVVLLFGLGGLGFQRTELINFEKKNAIFKIAAYLFFSIHGLLLTYKSYNKVVLFHIRSDNIDTALAKKPRKRERKRGLKQRRKREREREGEGERGGEEEIRGD